MDGIKWPEVAAPRQEAMEDGGFNIMSKDAVVAVALEVAFAVAAIILFRLVVHTTLFRIVPEMCWVLFDECL